MLMVLYIVLAVAVAVVVVAVTAVLLMLILMLIVDFLFRAFTTPLVLRNVNYSSDDEEEVSFGKYFATKYMTIYYFLSGKKDSTLRDFHL